MLLDFRSIQPPPPHTQTGSKKRFRETFVDNVLTASQLANIKAMHILCLSRIELVLLSLESFGNQVNQKLISLPFPVVMQCIGAKLSSSCNISSVDIIYNSR